MGETEYLLITIVFNFLFLLFVVAIISYVWQYKKKKRAHLYAIKTQQDEHSKELIAMQLEMQEKTMQEIGREIHDNVGQKLTLASLYLQNLTYENKNHPTEESIESITTIINDSLVDLRQLSKTLTDNGIATKPLTALLQLECIKVSKLKKCYFTYDNAVQNYEMTYLSKSILLRITQEFIQNSLKHSQCKTIRVDLSCASNGIILQLSDDGQGFDTNRSDQNGIGLQNMKKRTESIGGQFLLVSYETGTKLTIILPSTL
jgi:signal transduction histidine kinase